MQNLFDYKIQNKDLQESLKKSISSMFPIERDGKVLRVNNIVIDDNLSDTDFPAQRETKLNRKSWEVPVTADLYIEDRATGKVISQRKGAKVGAVPKITNRLSLIIGGNEYQVSNQLRRKSGVYSRVKRNGQLESEFNLEKGSNLSIQLNPKKEIFQLSLSNSTRKYRLYTLLTNLGMFDSDMRKAWGSELFEANKQGFNRTEESELRDLYSKLISKNVPKSLSEIADGLQEYFKGTRMNAEVTKITLGEAHGIVSPQALLDASKKLLKINKGEDEPDERDSLIFKNIYAPNDLVEEYFKSNQKTIKTKLENALRNREQVRDVVPSNIFTKPVRDFFTKGDLSSTPPQTNPVAMLTNARKTTSMGEGGITNKHSITMETRDVHPSQIGFLDSLSTPESQKVGVSIGLTSQAAKIGNDLATPVYMAKSGKKEFKTPMDTYNSVVGFPDQFKRVKGKVVPLKDKVKVLKNHKPAIVDKKEVDFYFSEPGSLFDFNSNLVPYLENTQGNRGSTAGRMLTQALPLDDPDTPLTISDQKPGKVSYEDIIGSFVLPTLEQETGQKNIGGKVSKITDDYIHINADDGKNYKVGLYNEFPLNQDGFMNTKPIVKKGDKIGPNTILAKSNYTDTKGRLAIGKNLSVGYVSFKGNSFEDGAVLTESAAKKLSHTTIDRVNIYFNPKLSEFSLKKFKAQFPEEVDKKNSGKLSSMGLPKIGRVFNEGEVLAAFLVKKDLDDLDVSFKKLNKAIYSPYNKQVTTWDETDPGEVVDVRKSGRNIDIYVKSVHPFKEGDKLAGRYGDKHIIGKIIPDDEAPHRADGTPLDIMVNPQGVQGRMNLGQMMDTAAGKLALKKGEPIRVANFKDEDDDMAKEVLEQLEKEGIKPDETLTDGRTGKPLENPIFVGNRQYIKLRHLVKKKQGSHSLGGYDIDEQPAGKGAQKMGQLDTYAYLGHGAKNLLREATTIKGRKNEEYFRNLQLGLPPGKPNSNFMFDKMLAYMQAAGVDTKKEGNQLQLLPLTKKRVDELSKGELTEPGSMLIGKNLASRKGGLFDPEITGGATGENYSHISLPAEIPNPMSEIAVKSILGLTNKDYDQIMSGKKEYNSLRGPKAILDTLGKMDVKKELENAKKELESAPASKVNKLNLKVRTLEGLHKEGLNPRNAYGMEKVLVIPPAFRPVLPLPSGDLQVADINKHYRDVGLQAQGLKEALDEDLLTEDEEIDYSNKLYYSVKALEGFVDPITYGKQKYKGALKDLGDKKKGMIFGKAWAKRQDLSGRSTITPEPTLGLDNVGIPEQIARDIYHPFIVKKLKERGKSAVEALRETKAFGAEAKSALLEVMDKKPVILNRAPALHKHSVQAFRPQLTDGKEIRLNPLVVGGFNADFDGDSVSAVITITYDTQNPKVADMINYLKNNVDFDKFKSYLDSLNFNFNEASNKMVYNDFLSIIENGNVVRNIHIKDFPHLKNKTKEKENITEYEVPEFIQVMALEDGIIKPKDVTRWSIHENLKMFKVRLQSNKEVVASDDHSLICYNPETNKTEKIRPEEAVGKLTPIPAYFGIKEPNKPLPFNQGYFIGAIVGDGWVDHSKRKGSKRFNNQIMLSSNDSSITEKVASFLDKPTYSISNTHDFNGHECNSTKNTWSCPNWSEYLRNEIGHEAINKKLPANYLHGGESYRFGLLSGLIDTDGSVTKVKAKSKKRAQYQCNYVTISEELKFQIKQLCASVGIRTSVNKYQKNGNTVYHISLSMVDLIKVRNSLDLQHSNKRQLLKEAEVSKDQKDVVPLSLELAYKLQKYINRLEDKSLYAILSKAKKTGYIPRATGKKLAKKYRMDDDLYREWKSEYLYNDKLYWDKVKSIEPSKETTGWDLTIPGPYVFMTSDLITVQDTMSVQIPVTKEGENEAKYMFPSKILFKHGDNSLVPGVSHEYVFGLSKLSEFGKQTNKKYTNIEQAKKDGLGMRDIFMLNGKKMTLGQWEINKILPKKYQDYSRTFKGKDVSKLLETIAKDEDSDTFKDVINHFKDIGANYAYKYGGTVSIADMVIDRSYRDELINKYEKKIEKIKDPDKKVEAWGALVEDMEKAQNEALWGKNRMLDLIDTGALSASKAGNVRQVLTAPGVVADTKGNPVPIPVLKSYSEGLGMFDYINTLPGVRKGIVDKSVNTQESGALTNSLLTVTRRLLITEEDCNTTKGIPLDVNTGDILGRTLLSTIPGVGKRNDLIDSEILNKLKVKKIDTVDVRSALTCKSVQGVCQKCYGALPNGKLPDIGVNVGVLDSEAITERSTQLTLSTFHTGGAVKKGDQAASFPRLEQLLKVPQTLSGKATLSPVKGKVTELKKDNIGGWDITVNKHKLKIEPGRTPVVKEGANVEKGEKLSDGVIQPQELGKLKNHLAAQQYIVDEISSIYGPGFNKKSIETVIRGISDNAEVTQAPSDSNFFRGDRASISKLDDINKKRERQGLDLIEYKPYFKSIDTLNVDNPDWFTSVTSSRVKAGLQKGVAKTQWANISGKDPIPAYIYGDDFGRPEKKGGEGFY